MNHPYDLLVNLSPIPGRKQNVVYLGFLSTRSVTGGGARNFVVFNRAQYNEKRPSGRRLDCCGTEKKLRRELWLRLRTLGVRIEVWAAGLLPMCFGIRCVESQVSVVQV